MESAPWRLRISSEMEEVYRLSVKNTGIVVGGRHHGVAPIVGGFANFLPRRAFKRSARS